MHTHDPLEVPDAPPAERGAPGAPAPHRRMLRSAAPAALAWSLGAAALAAGWAAGATPTPFDDREPFQIGALFNGTDPLVGTVFVLVTGSVAAAASAVLAAGGSRRALRRAGAAAGAAAAVAAGGLLYGSLLSALGYLPLVIVLGAAQPHLASAFAVQLVQPHMLFQLYALVWSALLAAAAVVGLRRGRGACADCGRLPGRTPEEERAARASALRTARTAVTVAVAASLVYPAIRLPWIFGVFPGFSAADVAELRSADAVAVGIGLGLAGLAGAVLMTGLVSGWGVRFPRWMAGLSGRRVPVSLAVVPAAVVAAALIAIGKAAGVAWYMTLTGDPRLMGGGEALHTAAFAAMPVWGAALAVATAAYAIRRRAECAACGQGLPEPRP